MEDQRVVRVVPCHVDQRTSKDGLPVIEVTASETAPAGTTIKFDLEGLPPMPPGGTVILHYRLTVPVTSG